MNDRSRGYSFLRERMKYVESRGYSFVEPTVSKSKFAAVVAMVRVNTGCPGIAELTYVTAVQGGKKLSMRELLRVISSPPLNRSHLPHQSWRQQNRFDFPPSLTIALQRSHTLLHVLHRSDFCRARYSWWEIMTSFSCIGRKRRSSPLYHADRDHGRLVAHALSLSPVVDFWFADNDGYP